MSKKNLFLSLLVISIIIISAIIFGIGKDSIQVNRNADAAIFGQVIENIYQGHGAISSVFASTQNFIDRRYANIPPAELLSRELIAPDTYDRSMIKFHAYWLLYAIAPWQFFFDSSLLLAMIHLLSYASLLCGVLLVVIRKTETLASGLLIAGIVLISPVFSGGIVGQFYPDRLFVGLGFLLCCLVYSRVNIWLILLVAIFVALINERAALIGGVMMAVLPFCHRNRAIYLREVVPVAAIGLALILYSALIGKLWLANIYYGNYLPSSFFQLYARFSDGIFLNNTINFLIANSVFLLLSLGNYRLAILAVMIMLPNLIGNVGGAEKVGWVTHYHSYYFPVLVFAAAVGFAEINKKLVSRNRFGLAVLMLISSFVIFSREVAANRLPSINYLASSYSSFSHMVRGLPTGYDIKNQAISLMPAGSFVMADELGMALLATHANVTLFPVSAKESDYIFIPCDWVNGNNNEEKNIVPSRWLRSLGFSTVAIAEVPAIGRCLYSKTNDSHFLN